MFYPTACFWQKVKKYVINSHKKKFGECFFYISQVLNIMIATMQLDNPLTVIAVYDMITKRLFFASQFLRLNIFNTYYSLNK